MTGAFVTGLVLGAGGSSRLGRPKQLLPYGTSTLLGHVLATARHCPFDQRLCVIGGGAADVRAGVDFTGVEVVENSAFGEGCSSSIAAALGAVDLRTDVLVLVLGDQPGVSAASVDALLAGRGRGQDLWICADDEDRPKELYARLGFRAVGWSMEFTLVPSASSSAS